NSLLMTGNDSLTIGNNGSLRLYAGGDSLGIGGNSIINQTHYAQNCVLYCAPTVTNLTFNGNGEFTGVIVAPQADAVLNGAGTNNNDFVGALMARSVWLNGHYSFHYDEVLARPYTIPPLILTPGAATITTPAAAIGYPHSLWVSGATGYNYAIETSTNLVD